MRFLITICARGGSKGIPKKNIKLLNEKPLIVYSIDIAKQFADKFKNAYIAISTDSDEIKQVASNYGIKSDYIRPSELAGDKAGKIDTIADVLRYTEKINNVRYDYVLDLDVTSPLRNIVDLKNAFEILEKNENAVNLFSVSRANRNPYFNMVEQKENGFYAQVKKTDGDIFTRQATPVVYDLNASFYFYKRVFFDLAYKGAITDKSLIYEVPHLCFDLDHPIDFEVMNFLMKNKRLDFEL
ncbi:MAG: acylneuraminate cytidylyltransferase family protein [Filimonas sp.]|nr:acylneuraminate cytidylyltransferase family protein [Filimonas sp.]